MKRLILFNSVSSVFIIVLHELFKPVNTNLSIIYDLIYSFIFCLFFIVSYLIIYFAYKKTSIYLKEKKEEKEYYRSLYQNFYDYVKDLSCVKPSEDNPFNCLKIQEKIYGSDIYIDDEREVKQYMNFYKENIKNVPEKNNKLISEFLNFYDDVEFELDDEIKVLFLKLKETLLNLRWQKFNGEEKWSYTIVNLLPNEKDAKKIVLELRETLIKQRKDLLNYLENKIQNKKNDKKKEKS